MKTTLIKYFIFVVILLIYSSCNKDKLNINPTDQYSIETFWKTEEQAKAGLTGCYEALRSVYGGNWVYATDDCTPNSWAYNENGGLGPLARGVQVTTDPTIAGVWDNNYRGIGRTNTFLDKIDGISMGESLKSRMIGEAKFLRALYYFNLEENFGGVPLILETPDASTQSNLPRDTQEKVRDQILKDLDEASAVLPLTSTGSEAGRATKGAALTLKARLLLYQEKWAEAAQTAQEIMNLNVYTLFPNYRELFKVENEHNSEVIFNVEFLAPRFLNSFDQPTYLLNTPAPLKDLVDAYLMEDGQTIGNSPLYDPDHPYDNRDPRLHQTIVVIGYMFNGIITELSNVVNTGFGIKKYTSFKDDIASVVAPSTDLNPILMRFSEVLLTYAEAQNELVGPDASVYVVLDSIRARPSVNMPPIVAGLSKDEMREVIRNERRIELAFEGLYYADIKRWKTIEIVNNGPIYNYLGEAITYRTFDKNRDYLWPIPYQQILENPSLEQNPNYH